MKLLLIAAVLTVAALSSACSFYLPIVLVNKTDQPIQVTYALKDKHRGRLVPELEVGVVSKETIPFPEDRIRVDFDRAIVDAKLLPGETMVIDRPSDQIERRPTEYFNLKALKITSGEKTVSFEGEKVFPNFRPVERSRFAFGPKYTRFVYEYSDE